MPAADPDRLFAGIALNGQKKVCAAVSGGGDSLALLFLLKNHLDRMPDPPALMAVTVDHGLRPESADEARMVARLCESWGVEHRTVVWRAGKPGSGLAAAAREARLDLLAGTALEAGAEMVFTGHTQDDQAETVSMRLARGAGRGAAGIAPATLYRGTGQGHVWFLRPLLHVRRPALRAVLQQAGISWIEDPSNENPDFERVRVRRQLDADAITALAGDAERAARERTALGIGAAALIDSHARRVAPGLYRLERGFFAEKDRQAALYAFRILAAMAGGAEQLAGKAPAKAAFDAVWRGLCATLSRAVVDVRRTGIHLHRESRNLPEVALAPTATLWDGRFWIGGRCAGVEVHIAGCPPEPVQKCGSEAGDLPQDLLFSSQTAEPALWRNGRCLGTAAQHPGVSCEPAGAPWARLVPSFDLAPADAVRRLCGARPVPTPPLTGHNRT